MSALRLILGDHLSQTISSLKGCDPSKDLVLMCEVGAEARYVRHHKKKIAFLFSAMRHFAENLKERGYQVEYTKIDDQHNAGSLRGEVGRALQRHHFDQIIVTHPGEYRVLADIRKWESDFSTAVEIRPDDRFLCTPEEFTDWAKDRKQLRMEYFYRGIRKKYFILMDGENPTGGRWNYDAENRKPPKDGLVVPKPYCNGIDNITDEVIDLVAEQFPDHFGDLKPFYFAVTRDQAFNALQLFIKTRLSHFGDYQDAMIEGEPWMYHSHISFYLNCGLLLPLECVHAAEEAYVQGNAPLNAVEGFIRQIIGWREYRENAYAHHIQRLMVLGNFALLAGVNPKQVNRWFLTVYADAYEWVELPNVSGMILFADGGYLASKPYAAGGSYINKMSNYCKNCRYKVTKKNGEDACPFNYLYWDFRARNREKPRSNHRIGMMYKTYDRMDEGKKQAISDDSLNFLDDLP